MTWTYDEWRRALKAAAAPSPSAPAALDATATTAAEHQLPPGQSNQMPVFRPSESELQARQHDEAYLALLTPERRNWCRWCLEFFDPATQKPRTIWERGTLRTHLMMSDDGTELVICDNCWSGAFGEAVFLHGQAVPARDPNVVPNLLLRKTIELIE